MLHLLSKFPGLLLDFDGTLADTEPLHEEALQVFFTEKGYEFGKKERGKSTLHIFEDWGKAENNPELAKKYLDEYLQFLPKFLRVHSEKVNWQEDAIEFLEKTKMHPRALVTGSFRNWLEAVEAHLKIFEKFPLIITKDDLLPDREKPDPYAYQLGAQKLNLQPGECLAVEDSRTGIFSAKQAGCFVIAVKRDSEAGFENADLVLNSLRELSL